MSEAQWSVDAGDKPVKKSVPKWVWFCGGGCLVALLIGIAAIVFTMQWVKSGMDPEVSWPALEKVLPHDQRPEGVTIAFYKQMFGVESFTLIDENQGLQHALTVKRGPEGVRGRKDMFQKEQPDMPSEVGPIDMSKTQRVKITVQDRELDALRMQMELTGMAGKFTPDEVKKQLKSQWIVDVTPDGFDGLVMMQTQLAPAIGHAAPDEITEDHIRNFLDHFRLGPR